jgi:hypothetical protein
LTKAGRAGPGLIYKQIKLDISNGPWPIPGRRRVIQGIMFAGGLWNRLSGEGCRVKAADA